MQTTTPAKIKDLNPLVYSELIRIEKIVDEKLITDTGSTDVGIPPVSTPNKTLWTQSWDALISAINTYLAIDRTVPYQKLMMSTANHAMHKLDAALAEPVKFTNLLDFGNIVSLTTPKTSQNLLYTDLDTFKTAVNGAWTTEQAKIDTFSSAVTAVLMNKGIEQIMKDPSTKAAAGSQGYSDGFKNLNQTLPGFQK